MVHIDSSGLHCGILQQFEDKTSGTPHPLFLGGVNHPHFKISNQACIISLRFFGNSYSVIYSRFGFAWYI